MVAMPSTESATSAAIGWFLKGAMPPEGHPVTVPIPDGRFQVGRRPDVNLCLPAPSVSKLHAEFVATDFALFVRDLGSTNGTFVNGKRARQDTAVDECDVVRFAEFEFIVGKMRLAGSTETIVNSSEDWNQSLTQLHLLLTERAVVPHFQPIVRLADGQTIGYEALARSVLPGLMSPREMFEVAERMNMAAKLSVLCRELAVEAARNMTRSTAIFLNTHPSEGPQTDLLKSLARLRALAPHQPIVLELHEAAITHPREVAEFRRALQELHIELAYDDFGCGQSRFQELAEVAPDYLKFDMSLIRGIHLSSQRQQIVAGLVKMALDLKIRPLAEGIEFAAEADVCRNIGFTHAQGYFYGKPASLEMFPLK